MKPRLGGYPPKARAEKNELLRPQTSSISFKIRKCLEAQNLKKHSRCP